MSKQIIHKICSCTKRQCDYLLVHDINKGEGNLLEQGCDISVLKDPNRQIKIKGTYILHTTVYKQTEIK